MDAIPGLRDGLFFWRAADKRERKNGAKKPVIDRPGHGISVGSAFRPS
jgi:hypothetical protein